MTAPAPETRASVGRPAHRGGKLALTSPDAARGPREILPWAVLLLLAALVAYGPALRGHFLWDDDDYVTENETLRSARGLADIWLKPSATPQYYPLTHTTFWLEYQLLARRADGALDPLVFHVTNVLVHAGGAVALWFVLRRLRVPGAWVAAATFALHPVCVESVAWITERKNVLAGVLFFSSILAYLKFAGVGEEEEGSGFRVQGSGADTTSTGAADAPSVPQSPGLQPGVTSTAPRWRLYVLSLALYVAALVSKTVACSMPAVVLVLLWWKRPRDLRRHAGLLVPFFAIGMALASVTVWMEANHVRAVGRDWDLSPLQRVLIAGRAVCFYAGKAVAPVDLTFNYERWDVDPARPAQWLFPLAVAGVLAALWLLPRRLGRGPLAAAVIYAGVLLPALGFVNIYPMRYSFVADHFQYLALPALLATVVAAVAPVARRLGASAWAAVVAVVLLVLGVLTWRQAHVYENLETLWSDTVAKNPAAWSAHNNLAAELLRQAEAHRVEGRAAEARAAYERAAEHAARAAELRPQMGLAHLNRGRALAALGRHAEAVESQARAIRIAPTEPAPYFYRAQSLDVLDRRAEALAGYRKAVELAPGVAAYQTGLGGALIDADDPDGALAALTRAIELDPRDATAHRNLGALYARMGRADEALDCYVEAVRLNPRDVDALIALGVLYAERGVAAPALRAFRQALDVDPNNQQAAQLLQQLMAAIQRQQQQRRPQPAATRP